MASCQRQVRHQNKKIEQVAGDDRNQLLEEAAAKHATVVQQKATSN